MASHVQLVIVDGPRGIASQGLDLLRSLEGHWSRFLPASDISRLNLFPGQPVTVHDSTIALVQTMCDAWKLTAGRYNPCMLPALLQSGYTSSIADPTGHTSIDTRATGSADPSTIVIDANTSTVTLPIGTAIDPGGIGKGLAGDVVARHLMERGARGALVSIGGDIAVTGEPPHGDGWTVGVEDPLQPEHDLGTITVSGAGIATSSTLTRRWEGEGGESVHHLIDPATGRTAITDIASVSVVASNAWLAEAHATALAVATSSDFHRYAADQAIDALAVTDDGDIYTTPGLADLSPGGMRI